jgi:dienelactone hydrolase
MTAGIHRILRIVRTAALAAGLPLFARAQAPASGTVRDVVMAPGANYDKAEFRFWYPDGSEPFRGVLVLVPGSNGDGRPMAEDTVWRAFATKHRLALLGCRFTDKPHDEGFIEEYINVAKGSGQAMLTALDSFATRARHPELAGAPLLLWGMSAGGEFNYEFVAWKPERVIAFVVNKGGIYYTALAPRAARKVPGLLFVGGKDLESRTNTIVGLFAVNRRGGALWALTEEPSAAHIVGRSRDMALMFYEDVLGLRLGAEWGGAAGPVTLRAMDEKAGFIGELKARTFQPVGAAPAPNYPTAWLPTMRTAKAWQAVVTEKPFEP